MFWAICFFCAAISFDIYTSHKNRLFSFFLLLCVSVGVCLSGMCVRALCTWAHSRRAKRIIIVTVGVFLNAIAFCRAWLVAFANSVESELIRRVLFYESNVNEKTIHLCLPHNRRETCTTSISSDITVWHIFSIFPRWIKRCKHSICHHKRNPCIRFDMKWLQ